MLHLVPYVDKSDESYRMLSSRVISSWPNNKEISERRNYYESQSREVYEMQSNEVCKVESKEVSEGKAYTYVHCLSLIFSCSKGYPNPIFSTLNMFTFCSLGKELPFDSVADVLNGIDMSDNVENTFNSTSSPQCDEMNDIFRNENDVSFVHEENTTTLIAEEISVVGSLLNQVTFTPFLCFVDIFSMQ